MSRMIAAFEALPLSICAAPVSDLPTRYETEAPDVWHRSVEQTAKFRLPKMELVHCCEEISEQLMQIRDELQFENSSSSAVQLRVFGD